jgi:hypothetical protein
MPYSDPQVVVSSAARTTSGDSGSINPQEGGETICLQVGVTAASGTPSMAIAIEWSNDDTNWATPDPTADTMTAITGITQKVKGFERKALLHRIVWTITGGTPSLTFSITEFVNN